MRKEKKEEEEEEVREGDAICVYSVSHMRVSISGFSILRPSNRH